MAKNKPTPEEQLLNLIEEGDGPSSLRQKRKKATFISSISLNGLSSFFPSLIRFLRNSFNQLKNGIKEPNLKVGNKVLAVIAVLVLIYLSVDFVFRRLEINQIIKKISAAKKWSFKEGPPAEIRPFLYYLEMVQRRDIFTPVVLKGSGPTDSEVKKMLEALTADLKLVGIAWGEIPEAIIEDKKANKTYFLKTGDMLNSLKVDAISKDKVTFDANGEKVYLM